MKYDDNYLKIKDKYEAVLYELMKEVSNQLDYDSCNILYKEMAITLIATSIDFDRPESEVLDDVTKFASFMFECIHDVMSQIKTGQYNGKIIIKKF